MKKKKTIIIIVLTIIFALILYYLTLPALNIHDINLWIYLLMVFIFYKLLSIFKINNL